MNCRAETFGRVVNNFDSVRKKWVMEMGFGGLLELAGVKQPRKLCYWLFTRLDPLNGLIIDTNGKEYPISPEQIHLVLGIPIGGKVVPRTAESAQMEEERFFIVSTYGRQYESHVSVVLDDILPSLCQENWNLEEEDKFKTEFLISALATFLCPTSCGRLAAHLEVAATLANKASEYNWCQLVYEELMVYGCKFASKFYRNGYVSSCGGCTYFLAVSYYFMLGYNSLHFCLQLLFSHSVIALSLCSLIPLCASSAILPRPLE